MQQYDYEWQSLYYMALSDCLVRYGDMARQAELMDLLRFIQEAHTNVLNREPLLKLNRWLGFIQGELITRGITTTQAERDWTRPLFRPLDFM